MTRGRRNGFGARWPRLSGVAAGAAVLLAVAGGAPASADDHGREPLAPWASIGVLTGSTQLDAGLADYQWDTTPRMAWGAQTLIGRGRLATGLRLWSTRTTQSLDGLAADPGVRATSWELVGEGRVMERWGTQVLATGSAGRLHIGYDPDRITIQPAGGGSPIVVDFTPVNEWIGGAGLALRRPLVADWTMGLGVDRRVFAMDTAHRVGNAIVLARESFGDWSARFELARTWRRR